MLSTKTGSPKAPPAGGGGGNKELVSGKNCSDVEELHEDTSSSDDDDDPDLIVETSPNGRWQKINTEVSYSWKRVCPPPKRHCGPPSPQFVKASYSN